VIGRAVLIYWPPEDWQIIKHTEQVAIPEFASQASWSVR
jgi:hypothetical protein